MHPVRGGYTPTMPGDRSTDPDTGPRAVLRVPEILMALAARPDGCPLAELAPRLKVPKTSLHRLLRTLERGGYVTGSGGLYRLGPTSFHLASLIGGSAAAPAFPASARPTLEWLAQETHETVMLGVLSGDEPEILYVDVIDSDEPIRFTLSAGDRRPLYCAASGMAALAFLSREAQESYVERTKFIRFTTQTADKETLITDLERVKMLGVAFDDGGKVLGAAGMAAAVFDADGTPIGSVSAAGPSERMERHRARLETLVRDAGARISRLLGYGGSYPPVS